MQCKTLPLAYVRREFGPIYLNSVFSVVMVFRIKQEDVIKVSACSRNSPRSGRWRKQGDFFLCWWKMLHWQLWTLSLEFTQRIHRDWAEAKPYSLPLAKVSSALTWSPTWGRVAWCLHSFSSGFLCKGREVTGQHLTGLFCNVTAAQWEKNGENQMSPEHFLHHLGAISQSAGAGNISLVITWNS